MAWNASTWPAAADGWIYISNYNDLVEAHNERAAEVGHSDLSTKSAGDWIEIGDIVNLRTAVEALITHFRRVEDGGTGEALTKSTCLTDAIGAADWSDASLAAGNWIHPRHYNEIRSVLNKLRWLLVGSGALATSTALKFGTDGDATYNTAWSTAKTNQAAASWSSGTAIAYLVGQAAFDGSEYAASVQQNRCTDIPFTVPDYGVDISDTKIRYSAKSWKDSATPTGGGPSVTLKLYDQADFAGTESSSSIPTTGDVKAVADVPTLASDGATIHYSAITNDVTDDYKPATPASSTVIATGGAASVFELLIELDFEYQ